MKRERRLTSADVEVWRAVAKTVSYRMPGASLPVRPGPPPRGALGPSDARPAASTTAGWSPPPQKHAATPGDIERTLRKRVAKGRQAIDATLDLHGFRQGEAHGRLMSFLAQSQARGHRVVLVVTGKGRSGEGGVLRRLVPLWLGEARLAPAIVGFGEAGRGHGDEGALYVHLRSRNRTIRDASG